MSQIELRIHAAASGIIQSDARWRDIANKTINFEVTKTTKISEVVFGSESIDTHGQSANDFTGSDAQLTRHVTGRRERLTPEINNSNSKRSHLKRKRNVGNNIPFKRSKQGLNPAYKAPLLAKPQPSIVETPRPRSAPEITVLVPFTVSSGRQRARSDESQERSTQSLSPLEGDSSRVDDTSLFETSPTSERPSRYSDATLGLLTNNSFERYRFPGNQEQLAALRRDSLPVSDDNDVTVQLSQTSLNEADLTMGTRRHLEDMGNSVIDDSSMRSLQRSQSSERTASVSPSEMRKFQQSSPLLQRSVAAPTPTAVIDLTRESEEPLPQITHRDLLGPLSSPIRGSTSCDDFDQVYDSINGLTKHVYCAATNTNSKQQFKTCITPNLAELAERFDMKNNFQLCAATGNVKNRTRGYWRLLIAIDDVGSSARTHASSLTSSQWIDRKFMVRQVGEVNASATTPEREAFVRQTKYPPKDPTKPVVWSADEFLSFWAVLSKAVEHGRAGYDSYLEVNRLQRSEQGIQLKIRMFCWGEVLAHTWLLMYAASDGAVAKTPAQWFVPNFKKYGIVLTMSGQPQNPGNIGRWVEKSSGPGGQWGLEQTWDGIWSVQ